MYKDTQNITKRFEKIIWDIIPCIILNDNNVYIVPFSDYKVYWSDYANSYIQHYYDDKYLDKQHSIISIYLDSYV